MTKYLLALIILCSCGIYSTASDNIAVDTQDSFNDYANGAMSVYSKFQKPSKEQSESFYAFIKSKWQSSDCSVNCSNVGVQAGQEYAMLMNIQMDK